jgi:adenylate cyclase
MEIISFAFDDGSEALYFYVLFTDLFLNTLRQLNLMLGQGNLSKLLTGKFYHPREEERIFMFLDLQSSTQLAERLGHIVYSSLIQDCFNDLGVVIEDCAEIYQYVGDEAVLTWSFSTGIQDENFVKAFFHFKD